MGGYMITGLLKGQLFNELLIKNLPVKTIEECPIPVGITAFDLCNLKTRVITSGNLAQAIQASCTFPGLFQPVSIDGTPHIDGGVFDDVGIMALPGADDSHKLIINVVFGHSRLRSTVIPDRFKNAKLITIVVECVPMVFPWNMSDMGPVAFSIAKRAMSAALNIATLTQIKSNHFSCVVDGSIVGITNSPSDEFKKEEMTDED